MRQVNEMPKEGQFVAVYKYNNSVWSGTYQWDEEGLVNEYCLYDDEFVLVGGMGDENSLPWVYNENVYPLFFVGEED